MGVALGLFQRLGCSEVGESQGVAIGDEFTILIEDAEPGSAQAVAGKILKAAREPVVAGGTAIPIGTSIGIAYAHGPVTPEALMEQADAALYAAKKAGRGRFNVAAADSL